MAESVRQMTSLGLMSQFLIDWFKIPSLREPQTVIKSWFGDAGVSISHSILGCHLVFNSSNIICKDCELLWEKNHVFNILPSLS